MHNCLFPLSKHTYSSIPEDGLLRRVGFFDAANNEIITQTFHNLTVNPDLKDNWFEFIVPAGAHVIDATDDAIQALKTAQ